MKELGKCNTIPVTRSVVKGVKKLIAFHGFANARKSGVGRNYQSKQRQKYQSEQ